MFILYPVHGGGGSLAELGLVLMPLFPGSVPQMLMEWQIIKLWG